MRIRPPIAAACSPVAELRFQTESLDILVVDDNEAIRDLIATLLRREGYDPIAVADGMAARAFLSISRPSLVISDLSMPHGDGWGLLAYCHERHPDLPVMIVSGDSPGFRPEVECWAAEFMNKPFAVGPFLAAVARILSRAVDPQLVLS